MKKVTILILAVFAVGLLVSCSGGGSTSPSGYTQMDLTGTWQTGGGARYTFDSTGELTNAVGGGGDVIFDFSGSMKVLDSDGNVAGTIFLNHQHSDGQTAHGHDIENTGAFSSKTEINISWQVVGAGSGTTTWTKVE